MAARKLSRRSSSLLRRPSRIRILMSARVRPKNAKCTPKPSSSQAPGPPLARQALEPLLAVGRQPVHDLRPPAGQRLGGRRGNLLGDQPPAEQVLEARVQGPVPERAECAEHRVEPLAQLVSVHGSLMQQPEHGQLEYPRSLIAHAARLRGALPLARANPFLPAAF